MYNRMCVKEYSEVKNMKESIQPKYHDVVIQCTCGEKFVCGTTKDVVDTGGRVDKFKKRYSL